MTSMSRPPAVRASLRRGMAAALVVAVISPTLAAEIFVVPAGRSPLSQPGESFQRPIPARQLLVDKPPEPVGDPEATIAWAEARHYVGKVVTVEGRIVKTGGFRSRHLGQLYFLNFVERWRDEFYVVILQDALHGWPDPPDRYFEGALIRVTGRVTLYRKKRPQIAVRRPEQIEIVTIDKATAAPEATSDH